MALQRVSIRSFLASAKSSLKNAAQEAKSITFVVGNESAGKFESSHDVFLTENTSVLPIFPSFRISFSAFVSRDSKTCLIFLQISTLCAVL